MKKAKKYYTLHHHRHQHHPDYHNSLWGDWLQQPACVPAAKGEESGSGLHLWARIMDMFVIIIIIIRIIICVNNCRLTPSDGFVNSNGQNVWLDNFFSNIITTNTKLISTTSPASLWAISSVAGCLLGSILSDLLGRRKALMVIRIMLS